jgi:hypothetical protein
MTGQEIQQSFDDIRKLFRETDEKLTKELRERDEKFDRHHRETDEKWEKSHQEMVEGFRELRELFKKTDRKFEETAQRFKETDKKTRELEDLFTGQWGKLVEALMEPGAAKLFQERGIRVIGVFPRIKQQRNGNQMEIDLMLKNDDVVVVVEVKTTLKVDHVREFLEQINRFEDFFPEYKGRRIYGAVAGVNIEEKSDRFAYQQGLFVLGTGGEGTVRMLNDLKFKPKDFARRD